jgi:hypothetical protein
MTKERMDKLTAALEGAGFELYSMREEVIRDVIDSCMYASSLLPRMPGEEGEPTLVDRTGTIELRVRPLLPG